MQSTFPENLSIQTTSICNAHCIFCPYEQIKDKFPAKVMDNSLFRKIIDESSSYRQIKRIILYMNNEPLTDKFIIERINYAKEKIPWSSVHLLTNGSLLNDALIRNLLDSRLDWIGFSLHGVRKQTFEKTMGIDYDKTFKNVNNFINSAKEVKNIKEYVMVTFLRHIYLSESEKEEAFAYWKSKGIERISYFDGPVSRAGNVKNMPTVRNHSVYGCNSIWANEMMHIVEDGNVVACCMDWNREINLGNLNADSIAQVWNSQSYNEFRERRDGLLSSEEEFLCKRCEMAKTGETDTNIRTRNSGNLDIGLVTLPPWGVENPPIGLGYLDSHLRNKGFKTKIFDFNILFHNSVEDSLKMLWHVENKNYWSNKETFSLLVNIFKKQIEETVAILLSSNCKFFGFSVVDPKERITIEVIKRMKKKAPQIKVILGGPACSSDVQREFFLHNAPGVIDYFVVGEGEETLEKIIDNEIKSINPPRENGVAFYESKKWHYIPRDPIKPLDKIGFPKYAGINLKEYNGGRSLLVEWSRGCIGNCSFCKNYHLVKGYRFRSPKNIVEELSYFVNNHNIREFTVCDSLMNGNFKQLNDVCDEIIKKGINIRWSGQIASRKEMTVDLFTKMKRAGCLKMQIGVESGSDLVLKKMNKIYTSKISRNTVRNANKAGIETEIFIIIGFPGESHKEFMKTYDFIKHNAAYIDTVKSINTLHLIAGTEVYEQKEKFGIKELPSENWHYLWETIDGNNYSVRKERAQKILDLCWRLGIKVMETNIKEGKEASATVYEKMAIPQAVEKLKFEINKLQGLPQQNKVKTKMRRSCLKYILLVPIVFYTLFYIIYFQLFRLIKGRFILGGSE